MWSEINEDPDRLDTFKTHPFAQIYYDSGISWSKGEFEELTLRYFTNESDYLSIFEKIENPYQLTVLIENHDPFLHIMHENVLFSQLEDQSSVEESGNGLCFFTITKGMNDALFNKINNKDGFINSNHD